ncbi:MAG: helix-turn-helix domain-containing protein [Deltaproteobacteria bacterium]
MNVVQHAFQSYGDMHGQDLAFGTDAAGTFRVVDTRGYVETATWPTWGWREIDGQTGVKRIAGGPDGLAWVALENGTVHRMVNEYSWEQMHNAFVTKDIGIGADGTVKIVDSDGRIHTKVDGGSGWEENHKFFAASRLAITSDGMAWTVDKFNGKVYKQVIGGSGWEEVGGVLARDIAIGGPSGDVWIIAQDGLSLNVYRDGSWESEDYYLGGVEAGSIAVDREGHPWFVGSADGLLYHAFREYLEDLEALADNDTIGLQIEIQGHPRDPLQVLQSYRGNPQEVYRLTVKKYLPADLEKRLRERLEEAGIYTTDEPAEASSVVTPTRPGGLTPADIRQARKTADWTQAELAAKVGVSQKELSLWERAKKPIPAQREKKLRGVLGDYLAGADIP